MMNNPNNQDRSLSGFLAYLGNERNASEHTLESYKMDIVQFSKLTLNMDASEQAVDWDSVSVHDARSFIVALQGEDLSKTSRKSPGSVPFTAIWNANTSSAPIRLRDWSRLKSRNCFRNI